MGSAFALVCAVFALGALAGFLAARHSHLFRWPGERGDSIQTVSGRQFHPRDPRPDEVDRGDIAHALAFLCRFAGHIPLFYSVGDHSLRVMAFVEKLCLEANWSPRERAELALAALLHDASEAYVIDLPRPIKRMAALLGYRMLEHRVADAIAQHFGLDPALFEHPWVKRGDDTVLATEKRDMHPTPPRRYGALPAPLVAKIVPEPDPAVVRARFLSELARLEAMREAA